MKEGLNQFKMHIAESPEVINNVTLMEKLPREHLRKYGEEIYTS